MEKINNLNIPLSDGGASPPAAAVNVPAYAGPTVAARALRGSNRITCGASVKLWSIEGVAEDFGIDYDAAKALLDALGLPYLHLPGTEKRYINLYALESALFSMTLPDELIKGAGPEGDTLLRLHQELAGVMYMAATKEAVRERVKRFAKMAGFQPRPRRKKVDSGQGAAYNMEQYRG